MATGVYAIEIPDSVVVSAVGAALAVPLDRYAVVRAHVQDGETFLVNGVVVLSSKALDIAAAIQTSAGNTSLTHTVGANRVFTGIAFTSGGFIASVAGGGITSGAILNPGVSVSAGPSQAINVAGGGAATRTIAGYERGVMNTGFSQIFRLPPGATLSGGRYQAELYKIPGSAT